MRVSNTGDVSLALAVWLVRDTYDYQTEPGYVSATRLMRPIRHLVLPERIPEAKRQNPDVQDFIASSLGTALHDSIESAWKQNYRKALTLLGYPDDVIDAVAINPEEPKEGMIAVYIEQRAKRAITVNGETFILGGKFDMILEGIVMDNKSTTAYAWQSNSKDGDYRLQGSIYRWLNPDKVTEPFMRVNFIFTDWQKFQAKQNPNYPQSRVMHRDINLLSIEETERWIRWKLEQFQKYRKAPQEQIPECTDEELWRSDPKFKYYSDPTKIAGKSTKNFETLADANAYRAEKGKGIVITVPGEVKRCGYCDAYEVCTQKDRYLPT